MMIASLLMGGCVSNYPVRGGAQQSRPGDQASTQQASTQQASTQLAVRHTMFGVAPGMSASNALRILDKGSDALKPLRYINGKKILSDTVPATFCFLRMRRSFGFDSAGLLRVIGLTFKTSPDSVLDTHDCAFQWIVNSFGPPGKQESLPDHTTDTWAVGKERLTLETKRYNEHDCFLLIYYYTPDT